MSTQKYSHWYNIAASQEFAEFLWVVVHPSSQGAQLRTQLEALIVVFRLKTHTVYWKHIHRYISVLLSVVNLKCIIMSIVIFLR